jgi:glycosyltransferase involved in cell wall biosynthesis
LDEREKTKFLGGAGTLLFPVDWPEPFGLVMIEAMACGTPVVAFRCGSVPEVVDDGVTGFVVDADDALSAIDAPPRSIAAMCATALNSASQPAAWPRITSGFTAT